MLTDLIFSANAVVPIFILFTVGYLLKRTGFFTDAFVSGADKFVFKVALPCLLFSQLAFAEKSGSATGDLSVVWFCVPCILITCALPAILLPLFMKSSAKRGALIQGIFRSNFAILGIPLAKSFFGAEGARLASILLAVVIPVYNILAVWVLTVCDPQRDQTCSLSRRIGDVLRGIVTNPLIISILLALPFYLFQIHMPSMIKGSVLYFADISTPLALITIGANFRFDALRGRVGLAVAASVIKTVLIPALYVTSAILLGFRGVQLGIIYIVFGSPTAISSYIMAKNMNSDYQLAGQIVLLTTLFSIVTVFFGSFLLKTFGYF